MRETVKETRHELELSQRTYVANQSSISIEPQTIHNDQGSDGDVI
jgi:predicted HicB family RNase H-like nuclease